MRAAPFALLLLPLALVVLAPSPARASWPNPAAGVPLAIGAATGDQLSASACTDGAGGAIVAWNDSRTPANSWDIYVQRADASGRARWTANGVPICFMNESQNLPRVLEDGAGGAFITWYDARTLVNQEDIYAQHVDANGTPLWAANGVPVCTALGSQTDPRIVSDGAGGVFIAWRDARGANAQGYGQHLNAAGTALWTAGGIRLTTNATTAVDGIELVADGMGGMGLGWRDLRSAPSAAVMTHLDGNGASTWSPVEWTRNNPINELPVVASDGRGGTFSAISSGSAVVVQFMSSGSDRSFATNAAQGIVSSNFTKVVMTADGLGGVIACWLDGATGVRAAQRIGPDGSRLWPSPVVCASIGTTTLPAIVPDGSGGATIIQYTFPVGFYFAMTAVHLRRDGTLDWPADRGLIEANAMYSYRMTAVSDGAGGVIAAWDEGAVPNGADLMCQRLDRFGFGGAEPQIVRVKDVRNDQGGSVELRWNASRLDQPGDTLVATYSIWRQVPLSAAQAALARGARLLAAGEVRAADGRATLRTSGAATSPLYWEWIGQQPARGFAAYSFLAATASDSLPGSNPLTAFMVEAEHAPATLFWNSAPDSGYSVDNLPPLAPAAVAGTYQPGGGTLLTWTANTEADLASYRIYRGGSASFTPGPGNLAGEIGGGNSWTDPVATPAWYKLSAVDAHGNESGFSALLPAGTLGVDGPAPHALAFALAAANPLRGDAVLRLSLPARASVRVAIHDAAGRLVRELHHGELPAGDVTLRWDRTDAAGRVAADGLYFARLETAGRRLSARLVILR